jgi:ferredoxin
MVVCADAATPTANAVGAGGVGPYKSPGQMVKVMFYKPSDAGVGADWAASKPSYLTVNSKSERTIWEMGSRGDPMGELQVTGSGQDAYALSQMYIAIDGQGWGSSTPGLDFLSGKAGTSYIYSGGAGHFGIVTNHVTNGHYGGVNSYEESNGLLGCNNIYMRKLLQVTDNGKEWDGPKVAKAIEELWAENVTGNLHLGSEGTRLRYDMARMLTSTPAGGLEAQYAMQKLDTFMNNQIKKGQTPPGMSTPIQTDGQATNIRNLVVATFALVQGNPTGGVVMNGVSMGAGHHKGHYMRDRLMEWALAGGNSNKSDFHCAIKFESYAMVDRNNGWAYAERWDYANWVSTREGSREYYTRPANFAVLNGDRNRPDTFSLGMDYVNIPGAGYGNPAIVAYKRLIEGVRHGLALDQMNLWFPVYADPFTSRWSIFGSANPRADGSIYDGTHSDPNHYNYRGIFEFNPKSFEGGATTVNIGYTYLAPDGVNKLVPNAAKPPNFKNTATAAAIKSTLEKDEKGEVDVKYSLTMPKPNPANKTTYNLIYNAADDWDIGQLETERALQLLHRAFYYPEDRLNTNTNKYLPIRIEIKRENGGSGKILDDLSGVLAELRDCPGDHKFRIETDAGGTAVITFNMAAQTWCPGKDVPFDSPIRWALGESETQWRIENCLAKSVFQDGNTLDFKDTDIETGVGKVEVTYTFKAEIGIPDYKSEPDVFGTVEADRVFQIRMSNQKFMGWQLLPENGLVYPKSDWVTHPSGGYRFSDKIQRGVVFERKPTVAKEIPTYSNQGYEAHYPYYAEIKTGTPSNEPFEAMAGTPTTRDLYMSVGATDFRVSFDGAPDPALNPTSYLTYTYVVNVQNCTGDGAPCTGCGSCTQACPGHPWATEDASGVNFCNTHPTHTTHHPVPHTWTYRVRIPIGVFNYFDMTDSEAWRLTQWGLTGHEGFLTAPNPQKALATKFWGYNQRHYSSGNGRLIFNATQNGNSNGASAKYGDQTRTLTVSAGTHAANVTAANAAVNAALASEAPVGATVVSDYMVLGTSEGYQTPFFFTQDSKNTVTPSSAGTFSGEGGTITCPTSIEFDEKTIEQYWWQNNDKLTCAQPLNGWDSRSITFAGYNGKYAASVMAEKYINPYHKAFTSSTSTAAQFFSGKGLSIDTHPNGVRDGTGPGIGIDKGNTQHIVTGLDVIDTVANREYNTGRMWLQYNRVMNYSNNNNIGISNAALSDFNGTNGVYRNNNIPYHGTATKVNNIVIHNPVSAEYAIVKSNPTKYDLRTNAELMQGGDPVGTKLGACPGMGCQFSTKTCTRPIVQHTAACYSDVKTGTNHSGGLNTHVHESTCNHTHTAACYSGSGSQTTSSGVNYAGSGTFVYAFTATSNGTVTFSSTNRSVDPMGAVYINGVMVKLDDDSNGNLEFNTGAVPFNAGNYVQLQVRGYAGNSGYCYWTANINMQTLVCTKPVGVCTGTLNTHVCTAACTNNFTKTLICTDPHHYVPGEPVDATSMDVHYPIGDTRCWQPCYNAANHAEKTEVTLPNGEVAKMGGTFINIDREFTIYYPFVGNFAEDPTLRGIADTTNTRGYGYVNNMNTRVWTKHRWVSFPFDVIDPANKMRKAYTKIDLNDFSTTDTLFEFYCVLANDERAGCTTEFTSTAINGPSATAGGYFNDSDGITNKLRAPAIKGAKHSGLKTHNIDVVGSIGAMTIHDTGDFRFATTFKMPTPDGSWLVPNLIRNVDLTKPNFIAGDTLNVRHEEIMSATKWLDTYGTQFLETGGKSGGTPLKKPIELPLTPADNVEEALGNQPMRPGYQLYMDLETIGNYYGETLANAGTDSNPITVLSDERMTDKVQIRPMYYSLDLNTGKYTPVDVYYGVNGEYMQVNQYHFDPESSTGVQNYYYYLDWLNESQRRNYSPVEAAQTALGRQFHTANYLGNVVQSRIPNNERDILGSANVLFLNDLNRTYIGSSITSGVDNNPVGLSGSKEIVEAKYIHQAQRWHFTLGLPSSSVFVEAGKPCTEQNILDLQSNRRVILCTLDVKSRGTVWTLDYSKGLGNNGGKFQIFKGGTWYNPPAFDENGNEVTVNAAADVTSNNVIVTVYPSDKTSADDVGTTGTH